MEEDISPESWQTREVYATFGLAIYFAQVLEHGIVNLIVWSGVIDGTYHTYEETEAANVELFRKTMGAMKKELINRRADLAHLDEDLVRALRLRNFLAHNYFRERSSAFVNEHGRDQMLDELRNAIAIFQEVDAKISDLTLELLKTKGVHERMPEMLEEVKKAGFGPPLPGI